MIGLASERVTALDLAQRLSVAGRRGVTTPAFLEDVCGAVADAFEFDYVAALRFDASARSPPPAPLRRPERSADRLRAPPRS
jgi:hypothetical protein